MKTLLQLFHVLRLQLAVGLCLILGAVPALAQASDAPAPELRSVLLDVFIKYLLPVLATAVAGGLAWLLTQLGLWIRAKWAGTKLALLTARVSELAAMVVADLEASLRPKLAEAAADGKLTPEEAAIIKKAAMDRLKELLQEHGIAEIKEVLGIFAPQVEHFLSGAIEKALSEHKALQAAGVGASPGPSSPLVR